MSPAFMTNRSRRLQPSEFRLEGNRQIRKRLAEPLLLKLGKPAAGLLLGDELVEEGEQFLAVLGDGPGRERRARDGLADLEDRLFGDQRLQVDDGVDDVI